MLAIVLVSILHSSHAFRIYPQGLERRAFFAYKPFRHCKTIPPDRFSSGCKFNAVPVKITTISRWVVCMLAMVLVSILHSGHAFRIYLQGLEKRAFFTYKLFTFHLILFRCSCIDTKLSGCKHPIDFVHIYLCCTWNSSDHKYLGKSFCARK